MKVTLDTTSLIKLGTSLSKAILVFWSKDSALTAFLACELSDLIGNKFKDLFFSRKVLRFFDRISESIAREIPNIFSNANIDGKINQEEEKILADLILKLFENTPFSTQLLIDKDLSPYKLADHIINSNRNAIITISSYQQSILRILLIECCNYIIEIANTLPNFNTIEANEILERESASYDLIQKIIEKLPHSRYKGNEDSDSEFETQYCRQVALKLDSIELFGINLRSIKPRYNLSTAYISLRLSEEIKQNERREGFKAEEFLPFFKRILIRGEPGSGKTTLLQWIAVTATRNEFDGNLKKWNKHIPFFIRLRNYSNGNFPRPGEFVLSVAKNISDYMPGGWVNRKLESDNSIVLIDGVDEIPKKMRPKAKKWLIELMNDYPNPIYIVSSRPTAIDYNWLEEYYFGSCFIQDLTRNDIQNFIKHWHDSCEYSSNEKTDNPEYPKRLFNLIMETPAIRNLASSPLLLSMLCAINVDRKTRIPKDRMDLYRTVLDTLLEFRDSEREIESSLNILKKEKEIILQDIAYWLLLNNYTDCTIKDATSRIKKELKNIQRISEYKAEDVFSNLIERSGLIREPTIGRINFIHKTFQEYLSAAKTIEENSIGILLDRCDSDQWHEVLVLAAGHANSTQRDQIIEGLLSKNDGDETLKKRRKMLALSCIETCTKISSGTMHLLKTAIKELFPPTTTREAKELATAGDSVIEHLLRYSPNNPNTAVLCIKCLTYIGTDNALHAIKKYCNGNNNTINDAILWAWDYFNQYEFGLHVLKYSGITGPIVLPNMTTLAGIEFMQSLKSLILKDSNLKKINTIAHLKNLEELEVNNCSCSNLQPLGQLRNLKKLRITKCPKIENFDFLASMTGLEKLDIGDCLSFEDIELISPLTNLTYLNISCCYAIDDIRVLEDLPNLNSVYIPSLSLTDELSTDSIVRIDFR